ncbi:MAG TPA: hypothetical protein VEA61_05645 [Allosphingosinicella sp.]|nr:hypothetical protein [Allosphingosinicella sp.]
MARALLLPLLLLGGAGCERSAPPPPVVVAQSPGFPALSGRVVDAAELLTPDQGARLERLRSKASDAEIRRLDGVVA